MDLAESRRRASSLSGGTSSEPIRRLVIKCLVEENARASLLDFGAGPELRAGLAFRTLAARSNDRAIEALLELAAVDGIVPLLCRTANFNWHRAAALTLLRNPGFRRIVLSSLFT
jgi:hypothetical protein